MTCPSSYTVMELKPDFKSPEFLVFFFFFLILSLMLFSLLPLASHSSPSKHICQAKGASPS